LVFYFFGSVFCFFEPRSSVGGAFVLFPTPPLAPSSSTSITLSGSPPTDIVLGRLGGCVVLVRYGFKSLFKRSASLMREISREVPAEEEMFNFWIIWLRYLRSSSVVAAVTLEMLSISPALSRDWYSWSKNFVMNARSLSTSS